MPRPESHRGYGRAYRRAPNCTGIATTADHDPPLAPGGFHLSLRPACATCNYGHAGRATAKRPSAPPSREW